jgi:hypothetical protein
MKVDEKREMDRDKEGLLFAARFCFFEKQDFAVDRTFPLML